MENIEYIFEKIENSEKEYFDFLKKVVEIESPTDYKMGVDNVGKAFAEKANEMGFSVEVFEQKTSGNLISITLSPDSDDAPICLSGHIDTVHKVGTLAKNPFRIENNRVYGPGISDCKGGCVVGLWAMDILKQIGYKRKVILLLQTDEETNSLGSNKATIRKILEKSRNAQFFLNLESVNEVKGMTLERKGIAMYKMVVNGVSGHAAYCYDFSSAITELAYKIIELEKYKSKDGISVNCGTIIGGTASNVVPKTAEAILDVRFANPEQYEEIKSAIFNISNISYIKNTTCTVEEISIRPSMPHSEKNYELFEQINSAFTKCGLDKMQGFFSSGGSDAAYITEAGIPVVDSIGVVGGNFHKIDEYTLLDKFTLSVKRIVAILLESSDALYK